MMQLAEAAEAFKSQVGDTMKEKGDLFDVMFEAEEKIRLGEEGWKERYYQVCGTLYEFM